MLKILRVPERLFAIAMWAVSLAFAEFLSGLGGRIIADLPKVTNSVTREQLMDARIVSSARQRHDSLTVLGRERTAQQERARLLSQSTEQAYTSARTEFEAWVAARTATTDPKQDPEVLQRTRTLDTLGASARRAQHDVEQLDAQLLDVQQAQNTERRLDDERRAAVESQYQRALFQQELGVFGVRLALTLPLLAIAAWFIRRKRQSQYWPLARGFVLFAVFTFFIELVPYLPSYGGYVRYGVGILVTAIAAREGIRAMQRYLAQRKLKEQQTEKDRRRALGFELALTRMRNNVCPGCERPIAGAPASPSTFCVYCGLGLYDNCGGCGTRKNAFFQYCPTCGIPTESKDSSSAITPDGKVVLGARVVLAAGLQYRRRKIGMIRRVREVLRLQRDTRVTSQYMSLVSHVRSIVRAAHLCREFERQCDAAW